MNTTLYNTSNGGNTTVVSTDSLLFTSQVINCFVLLIYFIFGLSGNIFNICLFTRPVLLQTSSSVYLLCTAIANLFVIIFVIPFRLFADGFNLDLTYYSLLSCRLVSYIYFVCLALPPFFTVLACADRWAASSIEVNRRRFASTHMAKRLIPLTIIVGCLLYSYVLVTFSLDPNPPPPFCSVGVTYATFGLIFNLIIYCIIPPSLMAIFSVSIILNVLRKRDRVMPAMHVVNAPANGRVIRRDRRRLSQMQVMLVCESIIECSFTLPFGLINLVSRMVDNDEYFLTIYGYVRLLIFFNYVSSFYIYTLSSKLYRNEFKKLWKKIIHRN